MVPSPRWLQFLTTSGGAGGLYTYTQITCKSVLYRTGGR